MTISTNEIIFKCPKCKFPLQRSPFTDDRAMKGPTLCVVCKNAEKLEFSEKDYQYLYDYRIRWVIKSEIFYGVGVPLRLQDSDWNEVRPMIQEAVPVTIFNSVRDGFVTSKGFGLLGGIGIGKSAALAALLSKMVSFRAWRLAGSVQDRDIPPKPLEAMWVDWPTIFSELQQKVTEDGFVSRLQTKMIDADLLILDDLGRESLPRSATEGATPFGHRILNIVLTSRNGSRKPVWWTSNLSLKDLVNLYDGSMLSRLMEDNPPKTIEGEITNRRIPAKKE